MDDRVSRIPSTRLCLGDELSVAGEDGPRWVRVVGLALEGDAVVVTGEGLELPVRLRRTASVRVHRDRGSVENEDELGVIEGGAWYPGDLRAAGSAVLQHASARAQDESDGQDEDDFAHYPGLYGGDLDHVVTALGGADGDLSPADLRSAAFTLALAARRAEEAAQDSAEEGYDPENEPVAGDVGDVGEFSERS